MADQTEQTETEQIASALLLIAIAVERFSADMTARMMTRFDDMESSLVAAILDSDVHVTREDMLRKTRMHELMTVAAEIVGETYDDIIDEVLADLETVSEISSDSTSAALALVLGVTFARLSRARNREIAEETIFQGATVEDWLRHHESDALFRFRRAMQTGHENDMSSGEIIDSIIGDADIQRQDGIFQQTRRNAEILIVTIASAVASAARIVALTEARGVVKVIGQLSVLDFKTSMVCIAYSGKRWYLPDYDPIGHNLPFAGGCPRHWRCRSQIIPIIDLKKKPTGTQSSESGEVPSSWTYEDWLRSRPEDEQRDILGAGRYELWQSGKLSASDLVDQRGNPLTVAELIKRFSKRPPR